MIGQVEVEVCYEEQQVKVPLLVVKGEGPSSQEEKLSKSSICLKRISSCYLTRNPESMQSLTRTVGCSDTTDSHSDLFGPEDFPKSDGVHPQRHSR